MSVNDDLPYLRREMDFVTRAVARRQPVLGVCLGAQLIARALGAPVYRNPETRFAWDPERVRQIAILEAPNPSNGFRRLVLRNDSRRCAMILIEWRLP